MYEYSDAGNERMDIPALLDALTERNAYSKLFDATDIPTLLAEVEKFDDNYGPNGIVEQARRELVEVKVANITLSSLLQHTADVTRRNIATVNEELRQIRHSRRQINESALKQRSDDRVMQANDKLAEYEAWEQPIGRAQAMCDEEIEQVANRINRCDVNLGERRQRVLAAAALLRAALADMDDATVFQIDSAAVLHPHLKEYIQSVQPLADNPESMTVYVDLFKDVMNNVANHDHMPATITTENDQPTGELPRISRRVEAFDTSVMIAGMKKRA